MSSQDTTVRSVPDHASIHEQLAKLNHLRGERLILADQERIAADGLVEMLANAKMYECLSVNHGAVRRRLTNKGR